MLRQLAHDIVCITFSYKIFTRDDARYGDAKRGTINLFFPCVLHVFAKY